MSKSFGWFCLITAAACLAITVLLISRLHSNEKLVLDRDQELALLQEQLQEVGHQGSQNEASLKEALDDAVVLRKKVQGLDEQKTNQDQLLRDKALLQQQLADLQKKITDAERPVPEAATNVVKARSKLAPRDNPNLSDDEKLQALICAGHMHQIGLAASMWASTHDDHALMDFVSLREFLAPMVLICPSAKPQQPITELDWDHFDARNISYKILPGMVLENSHPRRFAYCPIHGTSAFNGPPWVVYPTKYVR